ncbi:ribonuclease H-like domain-containing protein [Tanacetum coccineum]|uniref:Ribonuclease H-like domain-containing protein n=1 Tax=Tanacetum coccineum TaxID=301880 RepID=A0ABQ4ZKL5_9ASTR
MFVHGYTDDDKFVHDMPTIKKLDISDPLHLHPNDYVAFIVISVKLKGTENYQVWSCAMLLALEGKNKTSFIDATCTRSNTYEVLGRQWDRVNAIVLGWILNSISKELFLGQIFSKRAKLVWDELKETYDKVDGSLMKLMQFLMGLDECYMQIRSNILSRDVLPGVRNAYAIISSNRSNAQRPQTSGNIARPSNVTRLSTSGNRRPTGGPPLVCEKCGFNGYNIDRCFKIIRYPPDFGKKNDSNNNAQNGYNFKKRFVNNNSVGSNSSSSSSFFDKQISKLISLFKENSGNTVEKHNMPIWQLHAALVAARLIVDYGANQHLTYSDKFLVNVIDISKFGIKVSHPNETKALITKVGNMVLTKDITLYDVLVVLEYRGLREMKCLGDCNHPHHSSPTIDHKKNDLGYLHSSNGSASEDEMAATSEEQLSNSEGINNNIPSLMGTEQVHQPLRRSERVSTLPRRYKARLVAKGFNQKKGIDLNETFYPVVKLVTVRCLINLFLQNNWFLFQLDINNAFLYDDLSETVYMSLPDGYFDKNDKRSDYSLFNKSDSGMFLALLVYVDDIIITGNSLVHIEEFKLFLKTKFQKKDLGKLKYFLGIEVIETNQGLGLSQRKYCLDLLSNFSSLACKPFVVPLEQNLKISNEPTASDPGIDRITEYQKLIGKLIYLTHTRPDIS